MREALPRPEHPEPQWVREQWVNLNGEWEFQEGPSDPRQVPELSSGRRLRDAILVPFAPESKLSGLGKTDFRWSGTAEASAFRKVGTANG